MGERIEPALALPVCFCGLGFAAATCDLGAGLGLGRPLPAIRQLTDHNLVNQRGVELRSEYVVTDSDRAGHIAR